MSTNVLVPTVAALMLAVGVAGAAYAGSDYDDDKHVDGQTTSTDAAGDTAVLPIEDILARLRTAGYTQIREVEWERGRYEVEGRDAEGQSVDLYVDARTGEVLQEERDD